MTPKHGDGVFGLSAPPQCQMCDRTQGVGPLHISDVHPEVQYWQCENCGLVWATREEDGLDAAIASSEKAG